jgi:hypothetical protein
MAQTTLDFGTITCRAFTPKAMLFTIQEYRYGPRLLPCLAFLKAHGVYGFSVVVVRMLSDAVLIESELEIHMAGGPTQGVDAGSDS